MKKQPPQTTTRVTLPLVRCAIYTRKSTEERLAQEINSLDAQREAGEAFIRSQASEGWTCLPERYDDGGFTGANTDRPALQRLLVDIEEGKIDRVVCYKVDRLSRSLLDFAQMTQTFDKYGADGPGIEGRTDSPNPLEPADECRRPLFRPPLWQPRRTGPLATG
jgi:site-specific DNA recombinase